MAGRVGKGLLSGVCLQETELTSTGDRFGAPLHAQFRIRAAVVSFDGVQREEKLFADLPIRTPLGNKLEDLPLPFAQWLIQGR